MKNSSSSSLPIKSLKITCDEAGAYVGYLVVHYLDEFSIATPYGVKLTLPGPFKSSKEASAAGDRLYERYSKGEVSKKQYSEKVKLRGYRIIGKARFDADKEAWEPMLELKKIEEPNKGKIQIITGRSTVFGRNLFSTEERATIFAVDAGKNIVIDRIGLEI